MEFDWHIEKARSNLAKHGVSFDEDSSAFYDPAAAITADPDHAGPREDRAVLLGESQRRRLLVVVFVDVDERTVRIISARRATRKESLDYYARFA